jgi:hypothetical protein
MLSGSAAPAVMPLSDHGCTASRLRPTNGCEMTGASRQRLSVTGADASGCVDILSWHHPTCGRLRLYLLRRREVQLAFLALGPAPPQHPPIGQPRQWNQAGERGRERAGETGGGTGELDKSTRANAGCSGLDGPLGCLSTS